MRFLFAFLKVGERSKLRNQNVERRIEDRIRALCNRLVGSDEADEFASIAKQLRAALSDHVERLRGQVQKYPKHPLTKDRRSTNMLPLNLTR